MNQVKVIMTGSNYSLGRNKPVSGLSEVTAAMHFDRFFMYDTTDVWTADGWLVTAVQDDGVTCHVRKGLDVGRQTIEGHEVLYFKHSAKTKHWQAQYDAWA